MGNAVVNAIPAMALAARTKKPLLDGPDLPCVICIPSVGSVLPVVEMAIRTPNTTTCVNQRAVKSTPRISATMVGTRESNELLAISAGIQRNQAVAAARNACRMHFPHVPMRVISPEKSTNDIVFLVLSMDIMVAPSVNRALRKLARNAV